LIDALNRADNGSSHPLHCLATGINKWLSFLDPEARNIHVQKRLWDRPFCVFLQFTPFRLTSEIKGPIIGDPVGLMSNVWNLILKEAPDEVGVASNDRRTDRDIKLGCMKLKTGGNYGVWVSKITYVQSDM
jgi:hypothetical protein